MELSSAAAWFGLLLVSFRFVNLDTYANQRVGFPWLLLWFLSLCLLMSSSILRLWSWKLQPAPGAPPSLVEPDPRFRRLVQVTMGLLAVFMMAVFWSVTSAQIERRATFALWFRVTLISAVILQIFFFLSARKLRRKLAGADVPIGIGKLPLWKKLLLSVPVLLGLGLLASSVTLMLIYLTAVSLLSLWTIRLYARDKAASKQAAPPQAPVDEQGVRERLDEAPPAGSTSRPFIKRIRENRLHLFELLGGWPGALVAQGFVMHKSKKPAYIKTFYRLVALHCVAILGLITIAWFVLRTRTG